MDYDVRNTENSIEEMNQEFKYPTSRIWDIAILSQGNHIICHKWSMLLWAMTNGKEIY